MTAYMEYIDENLEKVLQDPNNIMYIKPFDVEYKKALFAVIKEDEGIYRKIQITKEQSKMSFPFEPTYHFFSGPGYMLSKKFISFNNTTAVNVEKLDGFKDKIFSDNDYNKKKKPLIDKIASVNIFATFNDGTATWIRRDSLRHFEKKGGIKPYIDLLKQYKEYAPKYDYYEWIEYYSNESDKFIIPELQKNKEEQPKVKKLEKDPNK